MLRPTNKKKEEGASGWKFSTFLETGSCRHSLPANKGELWYLILGGGGESGIIIHRNFGTEATL